MRALALCAALAVAAPLGGGEPAIGRFLIAKTQVGGFFAESVIVLVDHGENGSLGLIVNRPLPLSVAELLPDLPGASAHHEPGFLGGPVAPDHLLLLVRANAPPPASAPVLDQLHVSASRDTLRTLLAKPKSADDFHAYVGYAGWAPGQLDAEIARGDWLVAPADVASVFTSDPASLWKKLFEKHRMIPVEWRPRPAEPAGLVAALAKSITLSAPWRSAAASSVCPTSGRARSSTR